MLEHTHLSPRRPDRAIVLGAGGFVGGAVWAAFEAEGTPVLALARRDLDLLADGVAEALARMMQPSDTLVVISAEAPCKTPDMLARNVAMMSAVCGALAAVQPVHVIYVSSDAVYGDEPVPLTENSPAAPGSLHGAMHLARELMLKDAVKAPLAILRPTLIYGTNDPHNGYGPNRFRRLAERGEDIVLFGDGEERRDHILIEDVGELVRLMAWRRSAGILNAATGDVASFKSIAEMVVRLSGVSSAIKSSPRQGPMPHNGYRPFDISIMRNAFPGFSPVLLDAGLMRIRRAAAA